MHCCSGSSVGGFWHLLSVQLHGTSTGTTLTWCGRDMPSPAPTRSPAAASEALDITNAAASSAGQMVHHRTIHHPCTAVLVRSLAGSRASFGVQRHGTSTITTLVACGQNMPSPTPTHSPAAAASEAGHHECGGQQRRPDDPAEDQAGPERAAGDHEDGAARCGCPLPAGKHHVHDLRLHARLLYPEALPAHDLGGGSTGW